MGQSEEQKQDSRTKPRDRVCDRGCRLQVATEITERTEWSVFQHSGSANGLRGEI